MPEHHLPDDEIDWGPPDEERTRDRRHRLLIVALVLLTGTSAILLVSGDATAHTTFTAGDVAVTSNGGNLKSLTIAPSGDIHYQGLEAAPSSVDVVVEIKQSSSSSWETIGSKSLSASGLAGNVSYSFSTIDVLAQSSLQRSDFRASDGTTSTTDLDIRVTATLVGAGPNGDDVTASAAKTFAVSVTNVPAGGDVGGQANTGGN